MILVMRPGNRRYTYSYLGSSKITILTRKEIGTELPKPVIKHQKTLSDGQSFYLLGWDDTNGEEWVDESVFSAFESSIETTTSCNTRD